MYSCPCRNAEALLWFTAVNHAEDVDLYLSTSRTGGVPDSDVPAALSPFTPRL